MVSNYNIYLKSLTNPKHPPLSIIQVKKFLNISPESNEQDDLLTDLLTMATEYAEWYTEKSLMEQEWKILCIGHIPNRLYLPHGPLIKVEQVTSPNETQPKYSVETIANYIEFFYLSSYGKVEITYKAGHTHQNEIPAFIKEGILQHIAYSYENRSDPQIMWHVKKSYDKFRELRLTL